MQSKQTFIILNWTKTTCTINQIVIYATYVGKASQLLLTKLLV